MYTKEQLKKQLENMDLTGEETIQYLMHGLNISDMDFYFFQHIHGRI